MFEKLKTLFSFEKRSLANPSPELLSLFGVLPTAAGVAVTAESALRSPTTLAACRAIYESVAGLPFHLFERGADGTRKRNSDHPSARILSGDWAPWAGGVETRAAIQLDALLHGAGFGLIIRVNGEPREIHRLDPRSVTRDTTGGEPRYKVREGTGERVFDWRDMLVIATPGSTSDRTICLTHLAREAIGLDLTMMTHQGKLFSNGARPGGVLKHPKTLGEETAKRLKASFESSYVGGENSGRTMVLEDGMSFEPLQFSSTDAQFLELRRLAIQEIARVFKVPGTLIGDLDRATWRNVEELMRQFVTTCLMPWAEVWQSALERVLLKPDERATFFVEAVFDDMLRGDLAARFTAYRQAGGGAWLTRNEIRQLDNRPPIDGADELVLQAGQGDAAPPPAQTQGNTP